MPEEIDLNDEQDAALDAAWEKIGAKVLKTPPSPRDPEEGATEDTPDEPQPDPRQ